MFPEGNPEEGGGLANGGGEFCGGVLVEAETLTERWHGGNSGSEGGGSGSGGGGEGGDSGGGVNGKQVTESWRRHWWVSVVVHSLLMKGGEENGR